MEKIQEQYLNQIKITSDINEHIETLYNIAKECDHITEMGVRWVSSTWAFLYSNPKKLISYDIVKNNNINEVINLSNYYNINFIFYEQDVLKIEIEPTELLFIDTLHTYNQLIKELDLHSKNVSKYIILHDTTTFGFVDEKVYNHASDIVKNEPKEKQGLMLAVNEFLETELGNNWVIYKKFDNNNGLTILKRIK